MSGPRSGSAKARRHRDSQRVCGESDAKNFVARLTGVHTPSAYFSVRGVLVRLNRTVSFKKLCGPLRLCVFALSVVLGAASLADEPAKEAPITDDDRDHWAFLPIERPAVPAPELKGQPGYVIDWAQNPIDQFILAKLIENGLVPMPSADRRTLIRRLSFDLTGLPPTPEEVARFVNDPRQDAFEQLVERLLSSSAYGERWAQHWLDLARFAETDGFEHDKLRPEAWKYRDWVIDALNDDLPYDEFVLAQLAGDESPHHDRIATGFLTCGPDMPDINLQEERRHSFLNEMTSTVGSVFLGLQLECAQCHDHKFDPISQRDFYRMRAFFDRAFDFAKNKTVPLPSGNQHNFQSHLMVRGDFRRVGEALEPAFVRISRPTESAPENLDGQPGRRTQLARWITRQDNPLTARVFVNRLWFYHFGEGLSETPSDFGLVGDTPIHEELLNWLAAEVSRRGWSFKEMHRLIVTSSTWRQASRLSEEPLYSQRKRWNRALEMDPLNRLHSRGRRRRLEGEAIRDAILLVSGQLNQRRRGPGIRPPLPDELIRSLLKNQWTVHPDTADHFRRSIYLFVRRNLRYPLFEAFDKPDTNASCPRRNNSTIAPQALMLMNSQLTVEMAGRLAERLRQECGSSRERQIERLFELTLCRRPNEEERSVLIRVLNQAASGEEEFPDENSRLADLCLVMFNLNEFVYLD